MWPLSTTQKRERGNLHSLLSGYMSLEKCNYPHYLQRVSNSCCCALCQLFESNDVLQGFSLSVLRGKKEFTPSCFLPSLMCPAVQSCSGVQVMLSARSEGGTPVCPRSAQQQRGVMLAFLCSTGQGRYCLFVCLFKKKYSLSDVLVLEK